MANTTTPHPPLRTTPERSKLMQRVRRADTPPEVAVRKRLHYLGTRFRVQAKDLSGTPDIVNRSKGWAIFVHGCYWHAHEGCPRWRLPKSNRQFWARKFDQNRERDARKVRDLEAAGLKVLVVWQCELDELSRLDERLRLFLECRSREERS